MLPDVSIVGIVLDISLRSLAVAAVVWLVLGALRVRTAAVRHAAWTAATLAMLFMPALTAVVPALAVPFPVTAVLGKHSEVATLADNGMADRASSTAGITVVPSSAPDLSPPHAAVMGRTAEDTLPVQREGWIIPLAASIYLAGLLFFSVRLAYGWFLATALIGRAKRRGAISMETAARVYESPDVTVPMTVGVLRPAVILPPAWRTWDSQTLAAVVAHETAHVQRHDPAIILIARVNRALFWFHPLAWWLEREVTMTAEEACDGIAAQAVNTPDRYAEILLAMADVARTNGRRFAGQGVGVSRGPIDTRIDRLLGDHAFAITSWPKKMAVAMACACGMALAIACRQEVAATPLRPDPEVARRLETQAKSTRRFEAARDMTQDQADALEQRLTANLEDFDTREQLVIYYQASTKVTWDKKQPGLRRHALWLIANHPEHDIQAPTLVPQYDAEGYAAAKTLWTAHLAKPDASPYLIYRAARFFWSTDPAYAEQLIRRGFTLDPDSKALGARIGPGVGGYQWPSQLADLYASALTGGMVGLGERRSAPAAYVAHVRQLLDATTDGPLLRGVGAEVLFMTPWARDRAAYEPVRALGLRYLQRALEINPQDVVAKTALVRAQLSEQTTHIDRLASRAEETFMVSEDITEYARKDLDKAKQQRDQAKGYAEEVLKMAAGHQQDPAYSAAVMTAHHVLAALALRDGDRELAVRHLQDSTTVLSSERIQYLPQLSWMRPVNRLLKLGERERVADFLEKSANLTIAGRERLLSDARAIREGRMTSSYQMATHMGQ